MSVEDLITLFMDSRKRGTGGARRKSSLRTLLIYGRNLKLFADFLLTGVPGKPVLHYGDVRRTHIIELLDWIDRKEKAGEWRPATSLQMLRCLRTFFLFIDQDEECQEANLKGFNKYLPMLGKTPQRKDIPQVASLKQFSEGFNTRNRWGFRDYVATSLLLDTGIRIGELCNLRLDHTQLDEQVLLVTGKEGTRPVAITKNMVTLLKGWISRRASCLHAEGSPYVFISKYSGQMSETGFGHIFRKHCKKLGLPRITAHAMRHAMATNYLRKGGSMESLRLMTGHKSYEMLQNYLHLAALGGKTMQKELERVTLLKEM